MKKTEMELWVGLMVGPFLIGYLGARALNRWLIEVGRTSEELFRGERLPVLRIPGTAGEDGAGAEK
jgi:hypothetical protein